MPLLGILIDGAPILLDQVPPEVLTPEVISALKPDPHRHEEAIHLSTLGVCPHKVKMDRELGYYLPKDSAYRMIRGKAWDCLIEKYPRTNAIYHTRYWREIGGVPITGEPDLIDLDLKTIEDYKAPTWDNKKGKVYPSYSFQLNGYVWLTEEILRDQYGMEVEALYLDTCGPQTQIRIPVPMWSKRIRENEIARRLEDLQGHLAGDNLDPCGSEDCIYCKQEAYWVDLH